ncbi:hypothetical protein CHUAL_011529 [Chamberlinius hualienensis]
MDKYQLALKNYMHTQGNLNIIKNDLDLLKFEHSFYSIDIEIDVVHLAEFNSHLANFLLQEPIQFQQCLRQVICAEIVKNEWLTSCTNAGQLMVNLRIKELPAVPELTINSYKDLTKQPTRSYVTLHGLVIAVSTIVNYTHGANYVCQNNGCPNSSENILIRVHIPGAQECQTVSDDLFCPLCGSCLKENLKNRMISEKIKAEIIPIKTTPFRHSFVGREQAIVVYFRGVMARTIQLGGRFTITALTVSQYDKIIQKQHCYLEASNVITYIPPISMKHPYCMSNISVRKIKDLIVNLQVSSRIDASTAFLTPFVLAYYFAEGIIPKGCYFKTKLGLLCALATCGSSTLSKGTMSVLVIGEDSSMVNRLMSYAIAFAPSSTTINYSQQLKVSVRPKLDEWVTGYSMIEGNPLILATNGICYIGELNKFSVNKRLAISDCLINGSIPIEKAKQMSSSMNTTISSDSLPLKCQLWAYSTPSTYSNTKRSVNLEKHLQPSRYNDFHKCLLDAFSMVNYPDIGPNMEITYNHLTRSILTNGTENDDNIGSVLTAADYHTYLRCAQNIEVTFEKNSEKLVQAYFVASRRVRSLNDSQISTGPSINAISALLLLAESIAKLNLRSTVTDDDAICAINMYEESLSARYGTSCLNVIPTPNWHETDFIRALNGAADKYEKFKTNLKQFIYTYGGYTWESPEE